jgi:prevent-host-death family protein
MKTMPAEQFKARCLKVIDDVQPTREPVVITKKGRPVAKLVPAEEPSDDFLGKLAGTMTIVGTSPSRSKTPRPGTLCGDPAGHARSRLGGDRTQASFAEGGVRAVESARRRATGDGFYQSVGNGIALCAWSDRNVANHAIPADRLIGATVRAEGIVLITQNERIGSSPLLRTIW